MKTVSHSDYHGKSKGKILKKMLLPQYIEYSEKMKWQIQICRLSLILY